MSGALARAYLGNPMLGQQRAATRAADEGVSKAEGALRPHAKGQGSFGFDNEVVNGRRTADLPRSGQTFARDGQLSVTQTLFDGYRNMNGVRRSESIDLSSRERLRDTEQETLLAGATAYMDVLRDTALLALDRNRISVLAYELRGARARYRINEVNFTDVAQVASGLAQARAHYFRARAALATSIASYRRTIGAVPSRLEAARPIDEMMPTDKVIALALLEHPRITQALHDVDASATLVRVKEGELYPTVDLVGKGEATEEERGKPQNHRDIFEADARVAMPFYSGGRAYAEIRRAKEEVAAAQIKVDAVREQVRAAIRSSWGQLEASRATVRSARVAVQASEVALADVRAEASLGQRTTYDVLLAVQAVFRARETLVAAQRDQVVTSYELAAATGRLSAVNLGLAIMPYDPSVHFSQIKDKWFGLRTSDGQ